MSNTYKSRPIFGTSERGTFLSATLLSAVIISLLYNIYILNTYSENLPRMILSNYTNWHGISLTIVTPIFIGFATSLFIKNFKLVAKSLNNYTTVKFLALVGLFFAYLGVTFFGLMAILYTSTI